MVTRIVTDSTCDLPPTVIAAGGITVVPLYINIGAQGYLDGVDLSRSAFYERLPQATPFPTTAAPGPEVFRRVYEDLAEEGATEILSIHISESLSATVNNARLAAQAIDRVPVTVLDSQQLSLGTGFLVETAARAAAEGASLADLRPLLTAQIARTHVFAALDTLEFLQRSGRISSLVSGLGALLQLKPILKMHNGRATSERVRTTRRARARLVRLLSDLAPLERVALVHTHDPESAALLRQAAHHLLPAGDLLSVDITPVLGAHLGPGAVGFACLRDQQTKEGL